MPQSLRQKLNDDNFITWAQYSNIVGIVVSALMIAAAFWGVKTEIALQGQMIQTHLAQSEQENAKITKLIDTINEQQARLTRIETLENIK